MINEIKETMSNIYHKAYRLYKRYCYIEDTSDIEMKTVYMADDSGNVVRQNIAVLDKDGNVIKKKKGGES